MSCGTCGTKENLSMCSGCNVQKYCSKKCQKKDWKKHKHDCNLPECPICFERVDKKNSITTECGHTFHASCMMKHAYLNGFKCPYCRSTMVEPEVEAVPGTEPFPEAFSESTPVWSNTNDNWWPEHNENETNHTETQVHLGPTEEEVNMVIYGTPHVPEYKPTSWDIAQKLAERGLTMRHFVQAFLKDHDSYNEEEELFMRIDDELFEHIEEIINDMKHYPPAPP